MLSRVISFVSLGLSLSPVVAVAGQVAVDTTANKFICPQAAGSFCFGDSLRSNSVISCASSVVTEVHSCISLLGQIVPVGYEAAAVCYQSSPTAGDAVCAFNGAGRDLSRSPIAVPDTVLCDSIKPPPPPPMSSPRNPPTSSIPSTDSTTSEVTTIVTTTTTLTANPGNLTIKANNINHIRRNNPCFNPWSISMSMSMSIIIPSVTTATSSSEHRPHPPSVILPSTTTITTMTPLLPESPVLLLPTTEIASISTEALPSVDTQGLLPTTTSVKFLTTTLLPMQTFTSIEVVSATTKQSTSTSISLASSQSKNGPVAARECVGGGNMLAFIAAGWVLGFVL